jgi:transcriptional regulatory protein RtcR
VERLREECSEFRQARSLSGAGRALFAQSRTQKKSVNDTDRLRKYFTRFDLSWAEVAELKPDA